MSACRFRDANFLDFTVREKGGEGVTLMSKSVNFLHENWLKLSAPSPGKILFKNSYDYDTILIQSDARVSGMNEKGSNNRNRNPESERKLRRTRH